MDSAHRRREFVSTWPCFVDIEATCVMQTVRGLGRQTSFAHDTPGCQIARLGTPQTGFRGHPTAPAHFSTSADLHLM